MYTNKMRDQLLEQAFDRLGDDKGQGLHPYFKDAFRRGWEEAWRLSREAVVVELPELRSVPDRDCWARTNGLGFNNALKEARQVIEAQGLKVTP